MRTPFLSQDAQGQFFSGLHSVFIDESLADAIGWNTPRFAVNVTILSIMLIAVAALVAFYVRAHLRRRTEEKRKTANLFQENTARCKLSEVEADYLLSWVKRQNATQPHVIFQSLQLFESCLDAEVVEILASRPLADELKAKDTIISEIRRKVGFNHLPLEHPLASSRNISMGQSGSVYGKSSAKPLFKKAMVVENGPFKFTIQYNVQREDVVRIAPGHRVRFAFARQNDGLYGVETSVANTDNNGTIDLLHTLDLRRNQLRQYVRIETGLPLKFRLVKTQDPEKSEIKLGELVTARMSDISGGGLSFVHGRSLRLGDVVSLTFDLPGAACAGVVGKIVHLSLRDGKAGPLFKNHVQFINIEPRKREKIISYVFEKERQISQWR
jgi:c-di-GMP-binding flagellar brake protein YcgR